MGGDPYAAMVALMREQGAGSDNTDGLGAAPVRMRLGRVVGNAPLAVRTAGAVMPPAALRLNAALSGELSAGDDVLLFTQDDQIYYIVMKVVAAV